MDNQEKKLEIDFGKNAQELNISKEIYLRILCKGIVQTQTDVENLNNALQNNDHTKIKEVTHKLKGDYGNLRIEAISSLAKAIEDIVKTQQGLEKMPDLFKELNSQFNQLKKLVSG